MPITLAFVAKNNISFFNRKFLSYLVKQFESLINNFFEEFR